MIEGTAASEVVWYTGPSNGLGFMSSALTAASSRSITETFNGTGPFLAQCAAMVLAASSSTG